MMILQTKIKSSLKPACYSYGVLTMHTAVCGKRGAVQGTHARSVVCMHWATNQV